jgi:phage baseplate assembly protein W
MSVLPEQLDFPFGFDPRGRSRLTDDNDHVRDLIEQVLFTVPGERVNRPEFGTPLKQLVFEGASEALATSTEQMIHGALLRWLEPVISVERVTVTAEQETLNVTVVYARRDAGERRTEVFTRPHES